MVVARQQCSKHVSAARNKHATVEDFLKVVFSVMSVVRLYDKDSSRGDSQS